MIGRWKQTKLKKQRNSTIKKIKKYWGANNNINNNLTWKGRKSKLGIIKRTSLDKYHGVNKEISTKYGERNFRIIPGNVDDFRNFETIRDFDIRMNNKADIVCIQETHNEKR